MNEWEWQLDKNLVDCVKVDGVEIRAGDRVRLKPRRGADVLDLALAGQVAAVEAIEQDYDGKQHICVVLDNDPGRDLGLLRQPGHRFFFAPAEIEPLPATGTQPRRAIVKPSILVAGVGNIFMGDDAFGVEVVKRLSARALPKAVRVADFGIRGFDLVYALQDGYETTILVDACPQGQPPGTVFVLDPDLNSPDAGGQGAMIEAHGMNPMNVIRMARLMNVPLQRVLVVGCEPESLGGDEGHMGLSGPVEAAVDRAVKVIERLVDRILDGDTENLGRS